MHEEGHKAIEKEESEAQTATKATAGDNNLPKTGEDESTRTTKDDNEPRKTDGEAKETGVDNSAAKSSETTDEKESGKLEAVILK